MPQWQVYFATDEDQDVNGLVKKTLRCEAAVCETDVNLSGVIGPLVDRQCVLHCQSRDKETTNPNPWTTFWKMEFADVNRHLKFSPLILTLLPSEEFSVLHKVIYCNVLLSLSENPLHMFGEPCFFGSLTAHLHISAFATYIVCILLHGLLKSSAQRQGHNHLFARILPSTLKRGKWLLLPLDLFWKCLRFMTTQLQLKCTLFSTEGYIF